MVETPRGSRDPPNVALVALVPAGHTRRTMDLLDSERNPFDGRVVNLDDLPADTASFRSRLEYSIERWRAEGIRVVWLRLSLPLAAYVPVAVELGFVYHHADESAVELTLTLVDGSYIPPFATHYVGAGGVVLTDDGRLLVVSEAYRKKRHYKLPGGALHPEEHIVDAVLREVEEETGIRTEFVSLVCFRHWHGYRHGKSDIYFVCRLTPLGFEINRDPREISECFWMPVDEFLNHPDVHAFNRRIVRASLGAGGRAQNDARRGSDGAQPGLASGKRTRDPDRRIGLVPAEIEGYGTPATHEFFMPAE